MRKEESNIISDGSAEITLHLFFKSVLLPEKCKVLH